MNRKKLLWIACGVLLALILCGLLTWLGSGTVEMIKAHLRI
jgi:hypothetical protein